MHRCDSRYVCLHARNSMHVESRVIARFLVCVLLSVTMHLRAAHDTPRHGWRRSRTACAARRDVAARHACQVPDSGDAIGPFVLLFSGKRQRASQLKYCREQCKHLDAPM
jgi:hypothetical protein